MRIIPNSAVSATQPKFPKFSRASEPPDPKDSQQSLSYTFLCARVGREATVEEDGGLRGLGDPFQAGLTDVN